MLYARSFIMRNCGRFTHISSDFGSQYHTHTFVTSEALYASLTRGATWKHESKFIDLKSDAEKSLSADYFFCDYAVNEKPLWFTPGVFVDRNLKPLQKQKKVVDKSNFNVVDEDYPSTGGTRPDGKSRGYYCPTYGTIEAILPNHWMFTWAMSPDVEELECFRVNQIFMMGKKQTMFQIIQLSQVLSGKYSVDICQTPYIQVSPLDIKTFANFEVLAATARYMLIKGELRNAEPHWTFENAHIRKYGYSFSIPEFYLKNKIL
ncbi:hypothetical protein GF312_16930 [Candidatus Poribacteria bacterium]|nr:hypothetical protein [Candidatus Poribacteria bacterium]